MLIQKVPHYVDSILTQEVASSALQGGDVVVAWYTNHSDNERTKMDVGTRHILAIINGYDGDTDRLQQAAEMTQELLRKYASSDGGNIHYFE